MRVINAPISQGAELTWLGNPDRAKGRVLLKLDRTFAQVKFGVLMGDLAGLKLPLNGTVVNERRDRRKGARFSGSDTGYEKQMLV